MSRTVPSSLLTALSQSSVSPYYAVEMLFDSGPVRFWTGYGNRTIEGNTYLGAGSLLAVSGLEEVSDLSAKSATVSLSGVPSEIVSLALQEPYQNRACRILFGEQSVSDVVEMFSGLMNQMPIEDSQDGSVISLTVESRYVMLKRANVRRFNHESHISRYPTDTFFSYVADLQDRQVVWGRSQA